MPIQIESLAKSLKPETTVLLFGAGAAAPSGAPLAPALADRLCAQFDIPTGYSLSEVAGLVELNHSRSALIDAVRDSLKHVRPAKGLLNLPIHAWRSLYSTNYDKLIELAYAHAGRPLHTISSDFDFSKATPASATSLYKLHGDIDQDVASGHQSRIILTVSDYDHVEAYRNILYDRLKADIGGGHLVIIGHSLADPDIQAVTDRAIRIMQHAPGSARITLLMYSEDVHRAKLLESRGLQCCFAGVDDFFAAVSQAHTADAEHASNPSPTELPHQLRATTTDINHALTITDNLSAMFNGWPAQYADIQSGTTFRRAVANRLSDAISNGTTLLGVLIGAGGVGKTTAARQCLLSLHAKGHACFEHDTDHFFDPEAWFSYATNAQSHGHQVALFVDEAHSHLPQINALLAKLNGDDTPPIRLILASSRHQWYPRIKSPVIYRRGQELKLGRLEPSEIDDLMRLVEGNSAILKLVEPGFAGFSRDMKRQRLADRCSAELFVCLRNIFASEKFDDIILRDYATLSLLDQEVYRHVAAMESAKVVVHRQFVMRLLGIDAESIKGFLSRMSDIIHEYTVNAKDGIYAWRGRHIVIAEIVSSYKYPDLNERISLFQRVIEATNPTYEIEIKTLRELCNYDTGIASIPEVKMQNELLRQVISKVPGERVPRHRLMRNLIDSGHYEHAETEIRIFENDFGLDGPTARYKVSLTRNRALTSPDLQDEDRMVILGKAASLAVGLLARFSDHKAILKEYALVGIAIHHRSADYKTYDDAIARLRRAEQDSLDPDFTRIIDQMERRMQAPPATTPDAPTEDAD